ncbi:MAG: diphthine synthase [Sulfolobales archaeon]
MIKPTFYLIGLGPTPKHLTSQALEILSGECEIFFYEEYTSISPEENILEIEKLVGRKAIRLTRRDLEDLSGEIILKSLREGKNTCLATWGDPLIATTHISIVSRVIREGYRYRYIPGINSVSVALAASGLMIYRLGRVATITFPRDNILSEYPYLILRENLARNLHTVFLLDIDTEKNIFMSVKEAIEILLTLEEKIKEGIFSPRNLVLAVSIGSDILLCGGEANYLIMNPPNRYPQILIVPAKLYFTEEEYLRELGLLNNKCVNI